VPYFGEGERGRGEANFCNADKISEGEGVPVRLFTAI